MATRYLARAILSTAKPLTSVLFRSSSTAAAALPNSSPLFRPVAASYFRRLAPAISTRGFATTQVTEETLLDGLDLEHWLVVMERPEGNESTDEIIDSYVKTLAMALGSEEEEARRKIYSVFTEHYYAFGALVPEELSHKISACPRVAWVIPDSYLDSKNKDYGGEPFINGRVVPRSKNKPKRENRRVPESQPSKMNKEDSALESQPIGGAWMNEKSCVDKLVKHNTNREIEVGSPDYSISAAVKCLDEMEDFSGSSKMYLDACEILKDAGNKEMFMSLAPEMRSRWLQRALGGGLAPENL